MPVVKGSRAEKAAVTRRRMLDAAYDLFCERGFPATPMTAVAARAGVAVQTLYFTFGTKEGLLQEVHDRTVLGEDRIIPPLQPWHQAAVSEPDAEKALRHIVGGIAVICARVAPLLPVFAAVTTGPVLEVHSRSEELRDRGMRDLAEVLRVKRPFRRGVTLERATDLLFVLLAPATYRSFVIDRGWSSAQWESWTLGALLRDLY